MKKRLLTIITLICFSHFLNAQIYAVKSPNGDLEISCFTVGKLSFSVTYKGQNVILESKIGMLIDQNKQLGIKPVLSKESSGAVHEKIKSIVSNKNVEIVDDYNLLRIEFEGNYGLEFRAYNEGVAYRFFTEFEDDITVESEKIILRFPSQTMSYFPEEAHFISHYERSYQVKQLSSIPDSSFCSLPVLMRVHDTINVLVTEADLYDYSSMFFYGSNGNSLKGTFPKYVIETKPHDKWLDRNEIITNEGPFIAKTKGQRTFPWRVFIISEDDGDLVESDLVFQLSRPLAIENTDWIKPGRVAWDWYNANNIHGVDFEAGLNTDTYKYYIDFASEYGLEYIILDEGWSKSTTNIMEPSDEIDLAEVIRYSKRKNVGVILWTLWKPLNENLEEILKLYKKWEVKGIKVDFMQRADQYMVNYYEKVVKEAAKNHLLVDFHGAFKPAGLRRAYPNLLTYEGLKGNENNKWSDHITPEHNVTLPFTRMVAGPMDFTPGEMTNAQKANYKISWTRPMSQGTRCHQVAMYVVFESPLQMLCDSPSAYRKEKETTDFIAKIPSVWDETIVLEAKLADYIIMARRKGKNWYIGGMTDWTAREFEIDLSILPKGAYNMEIMRDGVNAHRYAEDYKKENLKVSKGSKVKIKMAPGGGWAAILSKAG